MVSERVVLVRAAVHDACERFAIQVLDATPESAAVVWDSIEAWVNDWLSGHRSKKLSIQWRRTLVGVSSDRSKLLIAVATATFAETLTAVAGREEGPDVEEIEGLLRQHAANYRAPNRLVRAMIKFFPDFLRSINFYESVRGKVVEERDVWLAGAQPVPIDGDSMEKLLEERKPTLIVDEENMTVRVDGRYLDVSEFGCALLVLTLKAYPGLVRFHKLYEQLWPEDAINLSEVTRDIARLTDEDCHKEARQRMEERRHIESLTKNKLNQQVFGLNKVLEEFGLGGRALEGVPKMGYRATPAAADFCVLGIPRLSTK